MKKTEAAIAQLGSLGGRSVLIAAPNLAQRGTQMNTIAQHTDYSLMLGLFSSVMGLCVMLVVWYAARTLWKTHRRAQHERQWRRAKGF